MHDHDRKWVEEQLNMLPNPMRAKILAKYEQVYQNIVLANAGKIEAEGLARREANTRLRECVDKYGRAYHGAVISPPRI